MDARLTSTLNGTRRKIYLPLFMIERRFAERLDPTPELAKPLNEVNADSGVRWLYSFLSADHRKTYCIYEAPD